MCNLCHAGYITEMRKEMSWTAEYPTRPGFYWIRNYDYQVGKDGVIGLFPQVVEVSRILYADGHELCVKFTGESARLSFKVFSRAEWQGPIEPEAEKPNRAEFRPFPRFACSTCGKVGKSFISWPTQVADGPHAHRHYSLICRECWIAVLTPEQREAYKV